MWNYVLRKVHSTLFCLIWGISAKLAKIGENWRKWWLALRNSILWLILGLAHLCEHVLFTGSELFPNESYSAFLGQRGGTSNAYTTSEHTNFHFDVPSEHFHGIFITSANIQKNPADIWLWFSYLIDAKNSKICKE